MTFCDIRRSRTVQLLLLPRRSWSRLASTTSPLCRDQEGFTGQPAATNAANFSSPMLSLVLNSVKCYPFPAATPHTTVNNRPSQLGCRRSLPYGSLFIMKTVTAGTFPVFHYVTAPRYHYLEDIQGLSLYSGESTRFHH